ncbi:MAG: putative Na+/H+ antiporter [Chthoniobacterales bacterium]
MRKLSLRLLILVFLGATTQLSFAAADSLHAAEQANFPPSLASYEDDHLPHIGAVLWDRIQKEPFNLVGSLIFLGAIIHTFMASKFLSVSHRYHNEFKKLESEEAQPGAGKALAYRRDFLQFKSTLFHFLGEVEAVFGIWLIPLGIAVLMFAGLGDLFSYIDHVNFTEPIFVVVIMIIASSRPVLRAAELALAKVATLGGSTPAAWWLSILTVGPLLGSFITEPAAMTICAILLVDRFYKLKPSMTLRYATIGLLFVNISVGGTLDHFAAPPVVMVAATWDWGLVFMFTHFGWKAIIGILIANAIFFTTFRKELLALQVDPEMKPSDERPVPTWITLTHLGFIAWVVFVAHHPALVVLSLLSFIAFIQATERNQDLIKLRSPLLVGFFLASLVIHGGFQAWWIAPVLSSLTEVPLMVGAVVLTAFNDNAAITYLASLVPNFSDELKYAVVAGAVTGGGLTVIANAPNPAGQSILQKHFGPDGVNPAKLLLAALVPTVIMGLCFMLLPS